jgi:DnaK suppressor protein
MRDIGDQSGPRMAYLHQAERERPSSKEGIMTQAEIDRYREQLLALARRITGDVSDLSGEALRGTGGEASGNLSDTPLHPADLGTDAFEQEVTLSLLENEDRTLEAIKAAVERIDKGTFGRCERCHKEISKQRLHALPFASLCVACARQAEADRPGSSGSRGPSEG